MNGMNGTVLVVDDEQGIRDMLARHLRFCGYEVHKAGNGREALELMESVAVDVVITDIVMPVMDGVELMNDLRRNHPTVAFVVITGYVELRHLLTAMRLGAEDCLFKPLDDLAELERVVDRLMERARCWERKLAQLRKVEAER